MSGDKRSTLAASEDVAGRRAASPNDPSAVLPAPGDRIAGKYEIDRVLGAGAMGIVVAARHLQLGQWVAIKFMRAEHVQSDQAVSRFLREARAAFALSSEHAAKVLDVSTLETGAPYMVMEYLAGVDLDKVLRQDGPLAVVDAVDAVLQACEAVAEAHSLGMVHRDLKPSNLFVTRRVGGGPLIKVLDFGISKVTDKTVEMEENLTASGSVMGSPVYMSPEQVRNAKEVDGRSDLWALGIILYELLTGETPFRGDTVGATFARILSEPPTPIRTLRPEVPEGVAAVIEQCLERDLNRRMPNVGELAAKLLPFAPPDAAVLVKRILRVSAGTGDQDNLPAGFDRRAAEPEAPWNQTGSAPLRYSGAGRLLEWRRSMVLGGAGVLAAAVISVFVARACSVGPKTPPPEPHASASPSTSSVAVAPLASSGTVPAKAWAPQASVVVEPSVVEPSVVEPSPPSLDAGHARIPSRGLTRFPKPKLPKPPGNPLSPSPATSTRPHETDVY